MLQAAPELDDHPTIFDARVADIVHEDRVEGPRRRERGTSVENGSALTLRDVLALGVEAQCVTGDGTHYLWRGTFGVKIDTRNGTSTLLTDPDTLPDVTWFLTSLGAKQLETAAAAKRPRRAEHMA
jgi:hypothetical protein